MVSGSFAGGRTSAKNFTLMPPPRIDPPDQKRILATATVPFGIKPVRQFDRFASMKNRLNHSQIQQILFAATPVIASLENAAPFATVIDEQFLHATFE